MKKHVLCAFFIIIAGFIIFYNQKYNIGSITYLTTSYTTEKTSIVTCKSKDTYEESTLKIKCVDSLYKLTMGTFLADRYGNKGFLLNEYGDVTKTVQFEYYNICDIVESEGYIYVLFSYALNKCKVLKYDYSFNKIGESEDLDGVPRNIKIKDGKIYILTNNYFNSSRKAELISISSDMLKFVNKICIDSLVFAYYIDCDNDDLIIYGNSNEDIFNMCICFVKKSLEDYNFKEYAEPALWIKGVEKHNNSIYVTNDMSIIKLNSKYEITEIYYKPECIIIDAQIKNKLMYILCSNLDAGQSIIEILDLSTFKAIHSAVITVGLEEDFMVPSLLYI